MIEIKEILKLADSFCIGPDEGTEHKDNHVLHFLAIPQITDLENMFPYILKKVYLETAQSTKFPWASCSALQIWRLISIKYHVQVK